MENMLLPYSRTVIELTEDWKFKPRYDWDKLIYKYYVTTYNDSCSEGYPKLRDDVKANNNFVILPKDTRLEIRSVEIFSEAFQNNYIKFRIVFHPDKSYMGFFFEPDFIYLQFLKYNIDWNFTLKNILKRYSIKEIRDNCILFNDKKEHEIITIVNPEIINCLKSQKIS